jgi:hypothetical protein
LRKILYTKFFNEKINEKVDVILSPEFYWIKKIDIPIKSLKDAKKIAKTLFNLEGDYIYDAFEIESKFFAVALPKNLKINIPEKYINSIRIAQTELFNYECIKIDENHYIQKFEDLLFCFPTPKENCISLQQALKEIKLSNKKFNINRLEIDKSVIIGVVLIFLLINISLILKTYSIKKEIENIQQKTEEFLNKNSLPNTSFQLNSILNNLKNSFQKQLEIKEKLNIISKTPLKKGEYFKELSFKQNEFFIIINTNRDFDVYFKKYFDVNSKKEKNIYEARLK